jgi:hypothetical protein
MIRCKRVALPAAFIGVMLVFAAAARADQSMGQLVYHFSYSSTQDIVARDSSNPAQDYGAPTSNGAGNGLAQGNGMSHYGGTLTDKGTITVDIVKKQPDGAVVVMVSEQGESTRRAPPAECVVYGNTNVICDPNKTVYTEEYTLLRFLAGNFVVPSQLDASRHWSIVQNSGNETSIQADYVINSNDNGVMQIGEKRTVHETGVGHLTTNIETHIGYDFNRLVPTSVDEYATQRTDAGMKGNSTTTYQTTLNLVSDTTAKT